MPQRLILGVLAGLATCAVAAPADAAIRFAQGREFPASGDPFGIVAGDFNGDGKTDIATANAGAATVSVLPGAGDGTLDAAVTTPVGGVPQGLATGNFNGDARPDLAVADGGSTNVVILLGAGGGNFTPGGSFAVSPPPQRVAVADFNNDGSLDLAALGTENGGGRVNVLLGSGTGSFGAATVYPVGNGDGDLAVVDLNGDNHPEILVANPSSDILSVLPAGPGGTFGPDQPVPVVAQPQDVTTGDFNGDGRPDAAVVGSGSGDVSVLLGDGAGGFARRDFPSGLPGGFRAAAADLDGDQHLDLALSIGALVTMRGVGDGTFETGVFQPVGNTIEIVAADLNADSLPDIASATTFSTSVVVALNTSGPDTSTLPPPVVAQTANVAPAAGIVLVKLPGRRGFVRLTAGQQIPVGSLIDTSKGSVRLTTAANAAGATQSGLFKGGLFKLGQKRGPRPITDLKLGGPKLRCRSGRGPVRLVRKRPRSRQLFGNAQGRFRTRGRNSTATVRGTQWLVKDTCAGTLTRVMKGTVVVRDLVKRKTKVLHAGQRYLARAR